MPLFVYNSVMASRAPRFLLGYVKWFIVPVAVGVLGYTIVGPKLSQMNSPLIKSIDKLKPIVGASLEPSSHEAKPAQATPEQPKKSLPEPEVRVSIKKNGN